MIELAHVKVISTLKTKNDFNNNYNVYTCFLEHLKVIVIITITKIYFLVSWKANMLVFIITRICHIPSLALMINSISITVYKLLYLTISQFELIS